MAQAMFGFVPTTGCTGGNLVWSIRSYTLQLRSSGSLRAGHHSCWVTCPHASVARSRGTIHIVAAATSIFSGTS